MTDNPMSKHQQGTQYPSIIQKVADFWNLFNQTASDIILNEMHFDPERSSSDCSFRNKGGFSNFDVGIQRALFDTYIRYVNESHDKPDYNFPTNNYRDSKTLKNIMKFRNLIGNEVGRIKTNKELNDSGFFKEVELNSCVCCNKEMEGNNFCNFCESGEHSEKSFCIVHNKNIKKEKQREGSIKVKSSDHFPGLKEKILGSERSQIKCSYCGGNDVKCDHCKGTGICKGTIYSQPNPCSNCIDEANAEVDRENISPSHMELAD